jgi:hypothetical protein
MSEAGMSSARLGRTVVEDAEVADGEHLSSVRRARSAERKERRRSRVGGHGEEERRRRTGIESHPDSVRDRGCGPADAASACELMSRSG